MILACGTALRLCCRLFAKLHRRFEFRQQRLFKAALDLIGPLVTLCGSVRDADCLCGLAGTHCFFIECAVERVEFIGGEACHCSDFSRRHRSPANKRPSTNRCSSPALIAFSETREFNSDFLYRGVCAGHSHAGSTSAFSVISRPQFGHIAGISKR